jgi:hypothetical protein
LDKVQKNRKFWIVRNLPPAGSGLTSDKCGVAMADRGGGREFEPVEPLNRSYFGKFHTSWADFCCFFLRFAYLNPAKALSEVSMFSSE